MVRMSNLTLTIPTDVMNLLNERKGEQTISFETPPHGFDFSSHGYGNCIV